MIDLRGCGRLIDFDLARCKDETGTQQTLRTVSFQYLSLGVELVAEHDWLEIGRAHV